MTFWPDHVLAVVLTVFFPLRAATFGYRRLVIAPIERVVEVRRTLYLQAIGLQWTLVLATLGLWTWAARDWVSLYLVPRGGLGPAIGMVLAAAFGIVLWRMRARAIRDQASLDATLEKLRHLERMLPRTRGELRLFYAVSITAGICEELLYRGYLTWYFAQWFGLAPAVAIASVIFGLGHAYQGWKGILATGVVGLVMAGIVLTTGSLWPAMAFHAVTDVHAGALAHAALTRSPAVAEPVAAPEAPTTEVPPAAGEA